MGATGPAGSGGGGVTDHNLLTGRSDADQHPTSAITGLDSALAGKVDATDPRLSDDRDPTAHAASHATSGTDPLTAADIGAAPVSHAHDAADVTSGIIAPARLGTGTADSTTVLHGDGTWGAAGGTTITGVDGITVDNTDPTNPIVGYDGGRFWRPVDYSDGKLWMTLPGLQVASRNTVYSVNRGAKRGFPMRLDRPAVLTNLGLEIVNASGAAGHVFDAHLYTDPNSELAAINKVATLSPPGGWDATTTGVRSVSGLSIGLDAGDYLFVLETSYVYNGTFVLQTYTAAPSFGWGSFNGWVQEISARYGQASDIATGAAAFHIPTYIKLEYPA